MNTEEARQLAIQYFEGTISPEAEEQLFEFLKSDNSHRALFRQWEQEWTKNSMMSRQTDNAWERLSARLLTVEEPRKAHHFFTWRRVAAVAAVLVLMAVSAIAAWQVSVARPDTYYTLSAPVGSKSRMVLPDNTVVWLNAGSTLRYSSAYNVDNRLVELNGEAYFEVTKQHGKEFTVRTSGYDVVVKGTRFDVSAYKDDPFITTSLMQGSVQVNRGEDHLMLKPGERVELDTHTGALHKTVFGNTVNAWIANMTDFDEIQLNDLAKILSRQFAVNIHIESSELRKMKLSISLRNKETIDDVLQALQRISDVKVRRAGKEIYITP